MLILSKQLQIRKTKGSMDLSLPTDMNDSNNYITFLSARSLFRMLEEESSTIVLVSEMQFYKI